jgi:hypothetical protein
MVILDPSSHDELEEPSKTVTWYPASAGPTPYSAHILTNWAFN